MRWSGQKSGYAHSRTRITPQSPTHRLSCTHTHTLMLIGTTVLLMLSLLTLDWSVLALIWATSAPSRLLSGYSLPFLPFRIPPVSAISLFDHGGLLASQVLFN